MPKLVVPSSAPEMFPQQFLQYTQQQQLQQLNAAIAALRHEIAARRANGAGGGGNLGVALANLETLAAANPGRRIRCSDRYLREPGRSQDQDEGDKRASCSAQSWA